MSLRDGNFVTVERIRRYSMLLLFMTLLAYAYILATSNGMMDKFHRPLGTDFSNIYAAGDFVREGKPTAPFYTQQQEARERSIFGDDTQFYGWHYPPFFLPVAGLLAELPYLAALALWLAGTGAFYVRSMQALWPQQSLWLPALAYPAVFVNIGHGHNGFLTAALVATALALLKPKPFLAGICFGLLAYKPQFGLLIPVALLAGAQYRAFASAAITVAAMVVATTVLYGTDIWQAFAVSLPFTREVVLEQGSTGFYKLQSVFAAIRLWGGSVPLAYAVQGGVMLGLAVTLWRFWRSHAVDELKYAALILGCFLATPYSLDYDMVVIAPAIVLLAKHGLRMGFAPYEKSLLALVFLCPLFTRVVAQHTLLPVGLGALLMLYLSTIRRTA